MVSSFVFLFSFFFLLFPFLGFWTIFPLIHPSLTCHFSQQEKNKKIIITERNKTWKKKKMEDQLMEVLHGTFCTHHPILKTQNLPIFFLYYKRIKIWMNFDDSKFNRSNQSGDIFIFGFFFDFTKIKNSHVRRWRKEFLSLLQRM